MSFLDLLIIYFFKGGLVKTIQETSYKVIPSKDALWDRVIPLRVLVGDCLSPDWVCSLSLSRENGILERLKRKNEKLVG